MKQWLMVLLVSGGLIMPLHAHAKRISRTLSFGDDVELYTNGNIALRAQCRRNEEGSGEDVLRIYATTTDTVTVMDGVDEYLGAGNYLTLTTPATDSELMVQRVVTGVEVVTHSVDEGMVLSLENLRGIAFSAESSVLGLNVYGGYNCLVSIEAEKVKRFSHK